MVYFAYFTGHVITVDDSSAVLSLHFVLDNKVLQPPVTETKRGVESQPAVVETSPVAMLTKQLRLCALMGELDSVAKDIKVGMKSGFVIGTQYYKGMKEAGKLTDVELAELRQIYADCKAIIVMVYIYSIDGHLS